MKQMPKIDAADAVRFLNDIIKTDADAVANLIRHRVECSSALGDHPTVQVCHRDYSPDEPLVVGLLGLLNGLFGVMGNGCGYIGAVYDVECASCGARAGIRSGEICSDCGEPYELGKLTGFTLMGGASS